MCLYTVSDVLLTQIFLAFSKDTALLDGIHPGTAQNREVEQAYCGDARRAGGSQNDILGQGHRIAPWHYTKLHRPLVSQCAETVNIVPPHSPSQLPITLMSSRSPLLDTLRA